MRIDCENGYYSFYPESKTDLYWFANYLGIDLVKNGDHYTYPALKDLKNYVLSPNLYGFFPSPYSFEGTPKEIMKEFDLVYNLATKTLVPTESIIVTAKLYPLNKNWISETSMIQAGTIVGSGRIVTFDGVFDFNMRKTIVRYFE